MFRWTTGERYRVLDMDKVPLDDQYEMCGLFKQSTFGDIDIKCKYCIRARLFAWRRTRVKNRLSHKTFK